MLSEFLKNGNLSAFLSPSITPIIALTPPDRKEEQLSLFLKSGNLVDFLQSKREIVTIEKPVPEKSPLEILQNEKDKLENDLEKLNEEIVSLNDHFEKEEKNLKEEKTKNKLQQQRIEELEKEINLKKLELNKLQSPTQLGNLSLQSQLTNTSEKPNILSSNGVQPLPPPPPPSPYVSTSNTNSGPPPPPPPPSPYVPTSNTNSGPPPPPPPPPPPGSNQKPKTVLGDGFIKANLKRSTMTINTKNVVQPNKEKKTSEVDIEKNKILMIRYMEKIISNTNYGAKLDADATTISDHFIGATTLEDHLFKISSSEIANDFLKINSESLLSVKEALELEKKYFTGINQLADRNGLIFNVLDDESEKNPSNDTPSQQIEDYFNNDPNPNTLYLLQKKCKEIFTFGNIKITPQLFASFDVFLKKKSEYEISIQKKIKIISQFESLVTDETLYKVLAVVMGYFTIESGVTAITSFKPLSSCYQFLKTSGRLRLFYLNHDIEAKLMIELQKLHTNLKIDDGDLNLTVPIPVNKIFQILEAQISSLKQEEAEKISELNKLFESFLNNFEKATIKYLKDQEEISSEEKEPSTTLFKNFLLKKEDDFFEKFIRSLYNIINLPWRTESIKCGVNIVAKNNVTVLQCNKKQKELDKDEYACIDQFNETNKSLFDLHEISVLPDPCNT